MSPGRGLGMKSPTYPNKTERARIGEELKATITILICFERISAIIAAVLSNCIGIKSVACNLTPKS